jgi:hypothetical protein
MISIAAVLQAAAQHVQGDAAITSWMTTNFPGETLRIQVGEDAVAPLGEEHAPFIVFLPSMQPYDVGIYATSRRPSFDVEWGIVKKTATTNGTTGIITYDGHTLADALGQLLVTSLQTHFGEQFATAAYQLMGAAPLWEGGMTVTLDYPTGTNYEPALA